jgi:hypothetical protein
LLSPHAELLKADFLVVWHLHRLRNWEPLRQKLHWHELPLRPMPSIKSLLAMCSGQALARLSPGK